MRKWLLATCLFAGAAQAADLPAVLQWSQRVELSPRVSGVVREVKVAPGERVKKGQPLVVLDAGVYEAKAEEARAAVAGLLEEEAEAKRDLDRTRELYERTVISTSELEPVRARHTLAKARLDAARARLRLERKNLEDSVLKAPFDGLVVSRLAEPGQNVVVDFQPKPLLVLARAGEMVARFRVPVDRIATLKPGQTATVVVGGQEYPGTIRFLGLEPVTGKDGAGYDGEVVFAMKDGVLRAGMGAAVRLP